MPPPTLSLSLSLSLSRVRVRRPSVLPTCSRSMCQKEEEDWKLGLHWSKVADKDVDAVSGRPKDGNDEVAAVR